MHSCGGSQTQLVKKANKLQSPFVEGKTEYVLYLSLRKGRNTGINNYANDLKF